MLMILSGLSLMFSMAAAMVLARHFLFDSFWRDIFVRSPRIAFEIAVLSAVIVVPPAAFAFLLYQWNRRAERSHGLCVYCGYDLRATPDRCPECGRAPSAKKEVSN